MDEDGKSRHASYQKSALLGSNGGGTFLAWVLAELAGYGLLVASASDVRSTTCTGLCFSDREFLLLLGWVIGLWALLAQLVLGLFITDAFHRRGMSPPAAGSAAFFTTLGMLVLIVGCLLGA